MLKRVTYSHALRAPKPWPSSPLSVTAATISTPTTLSTKTISSVVLNADLVSVVWRRETPCPLEWVGALVVGAVLYAGAFGLVEDIVLLLRTEIMVGFRPFATGAVALRRGAAPADSSAKVYSV